MYTNWPFTAKQTHIPFTCLSFARGGFVFLSFFSFFFFTAENDVSIKSDLYTHSIYYSQISRGGRNSSAPQYEHSQEEEN